MGATSRPLWLGARDRLRLRICIDVHLAISWTPVGTRHFTATIHSAEEHSYQGTGYFHQVSDFLIWHEEARSGPTTLRATTGGSACAGWLHRAPAPPRACRRSPIPAISGRSSGTSAASPGGPCEPSGVPTRRPLRSRRVSSAGIPRSSPTNPRHPCWRRGVRSWCRSRRRRGRGCR